MTRTPKLTDTQLMLLSAASQRDDGLLDLTSRLKGNTLQSTAEKLLKSGLAEEVSVDPEQPAWRSDEWESRIGLKITPAGLLAIGIEPEAEINVAESASITAAPAMDQEPPQEPRGTTPRAGSKKALVITLLRREQGASLDDLVTATGWLPHTTRAALTGLRQSGHPITGEKNEGGKTVYRLQAREADAQVSAAA